MPTFTINNNHSNRSSLYSYLRISSLSSLSPSSLLLYILARLCRIDGVLRKSILSLWKSGPLMYKYRYAMRKPIIKLMKLCPRRTVAPKNTQGKYPPILTQMYFGNSLRKANGVLEKA